MTSRREFLRTARAAAAAGLALQFRLPELAAAAPTAAAFEPSVYLRIGTDDTVTVWAVRLEMGQGVRTLLPMMIAEELEVEWDRIRVEQASPGGRFSKVRLHTSGSSSSSDTYRLLRTAGAAAREILVTAAAATWGVEVASCRAERGAVLHTESGRRLTFGRLADAASGLPVPAAPALKDPGNFRILGHPTKRVDGTAIVTGAARYGLDVRLPGMLYASIVRAPTLGATLGRFDGTDALKVPGVVRIVPTTRGIHRGVAVLATDSWSAMRGREAVKIDWTAGAHHDFDSERFIAALPTAFAARQFPIRHEGDASAALARASRTIEATYTCPFHAHAPMETMNCTAHVRDGLVELWVPTQTDVRTIQIAAKVAGVAEDRVQMHPALMGGAFGRRLFADFVAEAVELSQAVKQPVQVLWTRPDDTRRGYFHPATAERFSAGVDASGQVLGLVHKTTASDLTIYDIHDGRNIWTDPPKPAKASDAYASEQSPWGAYDNPYEFRNLSVDCADVTSPVPTGPWRAVEYPSTVFGRESFLDEIAALVRRDPIALRLGLLPADVKQVGPFKIDRRRLSRVLEAARDRSGWIEPLASDQARQWGRGVSANVYHADSYIAMVAEVSVARDMSDLRVHRITTVVDCGIALNPLGVDGQTESAITWGLSAALHGKIDFRAGSAVQGTFSDVGVVRIHEMPELRTILLDSGERPRGYGEHAVPLVAPAVANAVFAACGRRVRDLPITPAKLTTG